MSQARIADFVAAVLVGVCVQSNARADDDKINVDENIRKGLEFLVKAQEKDGSWTVNGMYSNALTSLGGMAMLMEGSTPREGRYANAIKKAIDFIERNAQPTGLLCNLRNPSETSRYMLAHGYAVLFLATAWHEETDEKHQAELQRLLEKAFRFTASAQNSKGGWGYVTASDGADFDEGCSSIIQLQSLLAARKMGLKPPQNVIDKAIKYFKEATGPDGGIRYSSQQAKQVGIGRPAFTAGAIACSFTGGDFTNRDLKAWLAFSQKSIAFSHLAKAYNSNEFQLYYFAQAVYVLGDEGHKKLVPDLDEKNAIKWSRFRSEVFRGMQTSQQPDGSWTGGSIGPVYQTIVNVSVLQLEKGMLPVYQR